MKTLRNIIFNITALVFLLTFSILIPRNSHAQIYLEILKNSKSKDFKEVVQQVEEYYKDKYKGKGSGYKQFKRWEYLYRFRLDSLGRVPNLSLLIHTELEKSKSKAKTSYHSSILATSNRWSFVGPKFVNQGTQFHQGYGRINSIAIDPADSNKIYVGTPGGGIWKTKDGGTNWNCVSDNIPYLVGAASIVIDAKSPVNNRTIYILTGDGDGGSVNSVGIFKSTDDGNTWIRTNFPNFIPNQQPGVSQEAVSYKLAIHPTKNNVLYAVTEPAILKSTDFGINWTLKIKEDFKDLEFNPANPQIIYASTRGKIYRSSDEGETWTQIIAGLPTTTARVALGVTPANPSYVYAFFGGSKGNNNFQGFYRSEDNGLTFNFRSDSPNICSNFDGTGTYSQSWYNHSLIISPVNGEEIYTGSIFSWRSLDGGLTWKYISANDNAILFVHPDVHALEISKNTLYSGNDGGIYKSYTKGNNWINISAGLGITEIYKFGLDSANTNRIYYGAQDNGGNFLNGNTATLWFSADGMEGFFDPKRPNTAYGSSQNGDLYRTDDNGINWNLITPPNPGLRYWETPFVKDPSKSDIIYAGFPDIFKSLDRGNSWKNISNGMIDLNDNTTDIAVAPSNTNIIYINKSKKLFKTIDGGTSWVMKFDHQSTFTDLEVHPLNPNIIWATGAGYSSSKVRKSVDGGSTWQDLTGNLPNVAYLSVVYELGSLNGIYVGGDAGVYYRNDTLSQWIKLAEGLPLCLIHELEIHYPSKKIRVATYGRGVWESDLYGSSSNKLPNVSITSPTNGASYLAPASITINANASDTDGSITKMEFFQGTSKLGEDLTSPYSFAWNNVSAGSYSITAKATDNGGAQTTSTAVVITVSSTSTNCTSSGTILREYWSGVSGNEVSQIPVSIPPTSTSNLNIFEGTTNVADNYGARYRGYVCAPITGTYIFWIACNDMGELWLSTDENPANKVKIAYVVSFTGVREWDKLIYQKSASINLVAGKRYYIEALHKEGLNSDNMAVGWQLPNGTQERPIPGNRLSPFLTITNTPPIVTITSPTNGQSFTSPANITINANASDSDGSVTKIEFYQGATKLGEDNVSPYSFAWNNVATGSYSITAKATDNGGAQTTSAAINITVTSGSLTCSATGTILREYWANTTGGNLSGVPFNNTPNSTSQLTIFESPINAGANYGSRVRGYICPPTTGAYTFWIASNDNSELYLSTNENHVNKVKIAYVTGYASSRQWDKFVQQKSALINLVAGTKYYIEAIHIQNGGTDNLAVGWQLPNGTQERPIPGNRLSSFGNSPGNTPPIVTITSPTNGQIFTSPANITINANASDSDGTVTNVEFYQGATKIGEDNVSPYSFAWNNVVIGNFIITAKATDNAGAQTTSSAVSISVSTESISCTSKGTILREYWAGVSGSTVALIPVNVPPSSTSELAIFEGPTNIADNYGVRYSGYVCAPVTGAYTFWIACNDNGDLWLSTDENPSNKVRIAYVSTFTNPQQWDKLPTQKSALINLVAGKKYYIEGLHKEGANSDNFAVGWQLPNGTQERPIPGNRLSPRAGSLVKQDEPITLSFEEDNSKKKQSGLKVNAYPNPINSGDLSLTIEGYQENKYKIVMEILSLQGKSIYSNKVACDITCPRTIIPIDHTFPKGVYIIKVRIDGQVFTEKLLID